MGDLFWAYILFFLKGVTLLIFLVIFLAIITAMQGKKSKSPIVFESINKKLQERHKFVLGQFAKLGTKASVKALKKYMATRKSKAKHDKTLEKQRKRSYILKFKGDTKASQVDTLRDEITAVLQVANAQDEVMLCLESPGGGVAHYGLLASQLMRIKQAKVKLTVCVDMVAASGGYLAAVIADRILAAPFAFIGSIGVVMTTPNIHDFLKKKDIEVIELTAGKHKRTVSPLGKCTEEGKRHTKGQLMAIHEQFKALVLSYRPQVDIEKVATGDYWTAQNAMELGLVDDLTTSDAYIAGLVSSTESWEVSTVKKKGIKTLLKESADGIMELVLDKLSQKYRIE